MSEREPWWAEFWAASAAIIWVIWSIAFTAGIVEIPTYRIITNVVPESIWYAAGFAGGVAQIYSLRKNLLKTRWWLCMFMAAWWGFLFIAVIMLSQPTPGLCFYLIFSAINDYSVYRLRT